MSLLGLENDVFQTQNKSRNEIFYTILISQNCSEFKTKIKMNFIMFKTEFCLLNMQVEVPRPKIYAKKYISKVIEC